MPRLFIVAGPNGAGKTTYAREYLPKDGKCHEFVNADLIAAGLSPFAPEKAAYSAGRLMLQRIRRLAARREDFGFETTLAGKSYRPLLLELKQAGYEIHLDFLWVSDLNLLKERVLRRVRKGGHDIPAEVQERRHFIGLRHLLVIYRPLLASWRLADNSGQIVHLIAEERRGKLTVADVGMLAEIEQLAKIRLMATEPPARLEEPAQVPLDPDTQAALRAFRRGFARTVLEELSFGLPVIQWSRERKEVVHVPAELLAPLARRILEVDGEPLPEAEERELRRGVPRY